MRTNPKHALKKRLLSSIPGTEETVENPCETAGTGKDEEEESDDDGFVNKTTGEMGGPKGPEPSKCGDWERSGRCSDFLLHYGYVFNSSKYLSNAFLGF
ncbi:hypothetical protein GIB67_041789 [Kingdonia uniflora]|uniref:Succinate dehydrogenase assembly factor 4, mitochondrial n=1 Tax=Kingdonia uniflora TaxID=39325 RepID=A0A7J7L5K5_9MAGN|nr:hypothetical protein GIB67_041789 [Kingdonia uniflora]